jgi:hypothetical protein
LSNPSSTVVAELQEQLLARERDLDSREGSIITWEESLLVSGRALKEVSAGCDSSHAHMGATRCDYLAQVGTSSSRSERCKAHRRGLDERATLLGLQEMNLEVREEIAVEELERGLRHSDRCNLPTKLYKAHARANEIAGNRATEVEWLSRQLVQVADVLID